MTNISENAPEGQPTRGRGRPKISPEKKAESAAVLRQRNPTKLIPETQAIHSRFFQAFNFLLNSTDGPKIKSTYDFVKKYGINHGNFSKLKADPEKFALPVIYLFYLVDDFGISAHWLLTGEGEMIN
ncbi:hypothetical protein SAMN04487995_0602 [Dyadobacter koreensis]|uniref:Uncharacterized protein n=1 Tax=Dyadobacter koreensis TaxID=408657 RepID=A0A1H6QT06_9BACT|nr:hypothetical protein [Dyadobacter koreensis]SEI42405.1 hypothetical protein SAMN04487995_0602 [Dyadobacter koreensis]